MTVYGRSALILFKFLVLIIGPDHLQKMLLPQVMFLAGPTLRYANSRSMNLQKALSAHQYLHLAALNHCRFSNVEIRRPVTGRKYFNRDKVIQAHLRRHARVFGGATWYNKCLGIIGPGSEGCVSRSSSRLELILDFPIESHTTLVCLARTYV